MSRVEGDSDEFLYLFVDRGGLFLFIDEIWSCSVQLCLLNKTILGPWQVDSASLYIYIFFFFRFHIYVLAYGICFSLSDLWSGIFQGNCGALTSKVLKLREILRDKKFSLTKNFPAGYEVKGIFASSKSDTNNSILILVLLTTHCVILNKLKKKKKNSAKYSEGHSFHVWKWK